MTPPFRKVLEESNEVTPLLETLPFVLFVSVLLNLLGWWCNRRFTLAGAGLEDLTLGGDLRPEEVIDCTSVKRRLIAEALCS